MSVITTIQNYYERLVTEEIRNRIKEENSQVDSDYITDVACVALNRLPARYIRHEVDMAFYMTQDEFINTNNEVVDAVKAAFEYVANSRRQSNDE